MTHNVQPSVAELILKAILGSLTKEEAEELRAWRVASPDNERLFQETIQPSFLEEEWHRLESISYARPLAHMEQLTRNRTRQTSPRRPRLRLLLRAAAITAFMVIAATTAYTYIKGTRTREDSTIKAGTTQASLQVLNADGTVASQPSALNPHKGQQLSLTTPRGGEFRVTLEDGTEVWLNAQSNLIYPETFSQEERRVKVEGEAYFHVAPDEQKPFIVETHGQLIQVLGTEFNVHSYADDKVVQTTLVRGSIAMQAATGGDARLVLTPGHQAVFSKEAHNISVRSVDTEVITSWREGKFIFENQTLEEIMLTLSRWYDFTYTFADPQAAATVFMGRIPRYADFADVIRILEGSDGLSIDVKGRKVLIKSKS